MVALCTASPALEQQPLQHQSQSGRYGLDFFDTILFRHLFPRAFSIAVTTSFPLSLPRPPFLWMSSPAAILVDARAATRCRKVLSHKGPVSGPPLEDFVDSSIGNFCDSSEEAKSLHFVRETLQVFGQPQLADHAITHPAYSRKDLPIQ